MMWSPRRWLRPGGDCPFERAAVRRGCRPSCGGPCPGRPGGRRRASQCRTVVVDTADHPRRYPAWCHAQVGVVRCRKRCPPRVRPPARLGPHLLHQNPRHLAAWLHRSERRRRPCRSRTCARHAGHFPPDRRRYALSQASMKRQARGGVSRQGSKAHGSRFVESAGAIHSGVFDPSAREVGDRLRWISPPGQPVAAALFCGCSPGPDV